jgi:hypothetical protein
MIQSHRFLYYVWAVSESLALEDKMRYGKSERDLQLFVIRLPWEETIHVKAPARWARGAFPARDQHAAQTGVSLRQKKNGRPMIDR